MGNQGPCQRDPLTHSPGKGGRQILLETSQPDKPDHLIDFPETLVIPPARRPKRNIVPDTEPRKQRIVLKHHSPVCAGFCDRFAVSIHLPRTRDLQTRRQVQQG